VGLPWPAKWKCLLLRKHKKEQRQTALLIASHSLQQVQCYIYTTICRFHPLKQKHFVENRQSHTIWQLVIGIWRSSIRLNVRLKWQMYSPSWLIPWEYMDPELLWTRWHSSCTRTRTWHPTAPCDPALLPCGHNENTPVTTGQHHSIHVLQNRTSNISN
jgi:hypothetical protein